LKKNILIRDLDNHDLNWIKKSTPKGVSQNEYIKSILKKAQEEEFKYTLFDNPLSPKALFGKLPFKFIDLFAGIGGFRCALTALGGKCVFTSEWDKYASLTYNSWYGDENVFSADIRNIEAKKMIPNHDILCAGFPCQPFSLAGVSKNNSLGRAHGFDDAHQGNLFFNIMNIVDAKKPPILFLENVKNLRSHDKGNTWRVINNELVNRNYAVFSQTIDARYWVPQHRERIFIVCFDKDIFGRDNDINFKFPEPNKSTKITLSSILSDNPPQKYMLSDKLWKYLQDYAKKHREKGNGFGFGLNNGEDVARTMSARYHKDGSEILINQKGWKNPRRLTPKEAMLLMGYTKNYSSLFGHKDGFPQVVSDTQAYKQFGNSVVPMVVEDIAKNIMSTISETLSNKNAGGLINSIFND
jgi:DNA (cytosine-5)-methyltransferase 1